MNERDRRHRLFARGGALLFLAGALLLMPAPAPAYIPIMSPAVPVYWGVGSPATCWNDATKTLTWAFYPGSFPQPGWPTRSQAGAAFQNALLTHDEIPGKVHTAVRAPDTAAPPAAADGNVTMAFVLNETSDYYGTDITGALGVTYVNWNGSGYIIDADQFLNADPAQSNWTTDGTVGANTYDAQSTLTHEDMHLWGAGHVPYLGAAVFTFARTPLTPLQVSGLLNAGIVYQF
jgi:hypothetical protein